MSATASDKRVVDRGSARERLLAAADELFYEHGVHTVGIDTVIARAGVAKASLYSTFGSKDALIEAYLVQRFEERNERVRQGIAKHDEPRAKMLAVFDVADAAISKPTYRGCAFINASAEGLPGGVEEAVSARARGWLRELFTDLARDAGIKDAKALGDQLGMLYDGAIISARLDRKKKAAQAAKAAAAVLIDAAAAR
ncbi:MAG TPA: TetR/AcrR family transcriptional regulator [Mycobacteriales bacterium]|nr:TetR/AcrR family transcriptional regulator [Mycobacteriales bacterium]